MALGCLPIAAGNAVQGSVFGASRRVIDQEVHELVDADVSQPRSKQHRENLVFADRVMQRGNEMFFRNGAFFEELLHQLVVALGDQFHQLLVRFLGGRRQIGRDLAFFPFPFPPNS